jgi:hypothetical protein
MQLRLITVSIKDYWKRKDLITSGKDRETGRGGGTL